jgi:hypothetical protein
MGCLIHYISAHTSAGWELRGTQLVESTPGKRSAAVVVLDIADETHTVDNVPVVRGGADAALLARRRLEREFPGVTLKTLLRVRRRRRENVADVVLIAADTAARHSAALAEFAGQHDLRGVYTPAMLVAEWLRRAGQMHRQVLVVLPTPAGLRLVFVDQGRPLLSRLMPQFDAEAAAVEIGRTVQYLHNTQRVNRDAPVEIWFWGMADSLVEDCLPAGDTYRVVATPAAPRLPDPAGGGFQALLQLVATRPPRDQLAPHKLRVGWIAVLTRRWSLGMAAAVLVMGFAMAFWFVRSAGDLRAATVSLREQEAATVARRAGIEADLRLQGLSLQQVQDLPEAAAAVQAGRVPLREALEVAGRVFGAQSGIALQTLEFQSAPLAGAPATDVVCGNERTTAGARLEAKFTVAARLGIRERAQVMDAVRSALRAPGPWRSSADAAALDRRTPLVATAGTDSNPADAEWATCLLRAGAA